MKKLKEFEAYNHRRYSKPWVSKFDPLTLKMEFDEIGGYTGHQGDEGTIYVSNPLEGAYYACGQRDLRKNRSYVYYYKYVNGHFIKTTRQEILESYIK